MKTLYPRLAEHYTRDWLIALSCSCLHSHHCSFETQTNPRDGDDDDHNDDNDDGGGDNNDDDDGGCGDDCDPIQLQSSRSSPLHKVQDPAISNHPVEKCECPRFA